MFHKNIPNNNEDIIRFLAKNFAGTKKVRNTILFCSVVIGIVAIPWSSESPVEKYKQKK